MESFREKVMISSKTENTTASWNFTCPKGRIRTFGLAVLLQVCFAIAYIVYYQYSTVDDTAFYNNYDHREINIPAFCSGFQISNIYRITSTTFSRASLKAADETGNIFVNIETFDKKNRSKRRGGDIILIWVKQSSGDGRAAGNVIDHNNGTYTGLVRVFWEGRTQVKFRLASASENTCLRYKALKTYGDIVYTRRQPYGLLAVFLNNNVTEMTACNTNNFIYGSLRVCNFTTLNGGMSWFCGHPTFENIRCSDLIYFSVGPFNSSAKDQNNTIQDPGYGMFKNTMRVNVTFKSSLLTTVSCKDRSPLVSWTEPSPSGYYLNGRWEPVNCHTALKHTKSSYRSCLRHKTLIVLGDSTVRHYVNFFLTDILGHDQAINKGFTFGPNHDTYHGHNTISKHGITIIYKKQVMPFYSPVSKIPINNISSFPQIIDTITRGDIPDSSIIMLLNYHTHFSAFHPEKYRERLKYLVASLKRFFIAKPSAKVFFKGPTPCTSDKSWFDPYISLQFKKILEEEFVDIRNKVIYLDVWEISVAHANTNVHPRNNAFNSQIHQFMSFIC